MFLNKFLEKWLSLALIASTDLKLLNFLAKGRIEKPPGLNRFNLQWLCFHYKDNFDSVDKAEKVRKYSENTSSCF